MYPTSSNLPVIHTHSYFPSAPARNGDDILQGQQDPHPRLSPVTTHAAPPGEQRASELFSRSPSLSPALSPAPILASPAAMFLSVFTPTAKPSSPDAEGEVVSGFTLGPVIGHGAFSIIRRASSASGGTVAVKIVRKADILKQPNSAKVRRQLAHEADIWTSLSHEHILPLFSAVNTSYADYFFTLFCPAGSLFDILKRDGRPALPQDDAGMMFRQVVRGLRYLHEDVLLVHRDVKLENVLVDESGVCRITDFGLSRSIGQLDEDDIEEQVLSQDAGGAGVQRAMSVSVSTHTRRQTKPSLPTHPSLIRNQPARHRNSTSTAQVDVSYVCQPGSLPYAAPELFKPSLSSNPHLPHPSQDIWAAGILLHTLLTGKLPFSDSFEPRLQIKIMHSLYELPPNVGKSAERVLRGCLDRTVSSRWTIAMVDEVAWGVGWNEAADHIHSVAPQSDADLDQLRYPPVMSRRNSSQPADTNSEYDETRPRSSGRVASSRSVSRAQRQRSQSRAPVSVTFPRHLQRSQSRSGAPLLSPAGSTSLLSASIMSLESASSASSDSLPEFGDQCLSPSRERGRRSRPRHESLLRSSSRSPSPSVHPTTPIDFGGIRYPSSMSMAMAMESPIEGLPLPHVTLGLGLSELDGSAPREVSRGRKRLVGAELAIQRSNPYDRDEPLDVILEPVAGGSASSSWVDVSPLHSKQPLRRAGSTPPTPLLERWNSHSAETPTGMTMPAATGIALAARRSKSLALE